MSLLVLLKYISRSRYRSRISVKSITFYCLINFFMENRFKFLNKKKTKSEKLVVMVSFNENG